MTSIHLCLFAHLTLLFKSSLYEPIKPVQDPGNPAITDSCESSSLLTHKNCQFELKNKTPLLCTLLIQVKALTSFTVYSSESGNTITSVSIDSINTCTAI